MKFKKAREEEPRISIAPLIDIVFLLLIFFMVTSHFDIASGVKIDLPPVGKRMITAENENRITIILDKSGNSFLEGEKVGQDVLEERLKEMVKNKGLLYLVLQADKDVSHGKVVEIMDLAKGIGVQSIIIAARWKSKELL